MTRQERRKAIRDIDKDLARLQSSANYWMRQKNNAIRSKVDTADIEIELKAISDTAMQLFMKRKTLVKLGGAKKHEALHLPASQEGTPVHLQDE